MKVLSLICADKRSARPPYSLFRVGVHFYGKVAALAELADVRPSFLFWRLIDADGKQLDRSDNVVVIEEYGYLQVAVALRAPFKSECALELWHGGEARLLARRTLNAKVGT